MQITDIRVRKITKEGKMKAVVSVTFDEIFVVHDIKVIEGEKGLFIAMPSRRSGDGEYRDIAHPINSEMRDKLQKEILEKYEEAVNIAQKLCQMVASRKFKLTHSRESNVTISLGVSSIESDGETPAQIIDAADKRLYNAKENGRNRVN